MATPFATTCSVVATNNYDTCGTFTRASINPLTPTELLARYQAGGLWAAMSDAFWTAFEMKACGIRTNGFHDWLMSGGKAMGKLVNPLRVDRGPSLIEPFIRARQKSVINDDYWAITQGQANSAYTAGVTGPLTAPLLALGAAGDRVVRVVSRYGLDLDAKWFVDKDLVYIFGRSSGTKTMGAWKVLASAAAANLSYVDVLIKSQNSGSAAPFDSAPSAGVLLIGGNNVNNFQSWCHNRPTLNPEKRVPFWYQTFRRSRCVSSLYREVYAKLIKDNKYFAEFADLPLAEKNRQDEERFQKGQVNTMLFGKGVSDQQTLTLWQNLEQVLTVQGDVLHPGTDGQAVAYIANMIGVVEQLRSCDRVRDIGNQLMNIHELFDEIYNIVRSRKNQGRPASSIDIYTDSQTAADFHTIMISYYKAEYGDTLRINQDIKSGRNDDFGFFWRSYQLNHPVGVEINILTHETFDDYRNALNVEGIDSAGRLFLILDIGNGGSIYPGLIASKSKASTQGELDLLSKLDATFACTLENVTQEVTLTSETKTMVVECPASNLWIENFSGFSNAAKTGLYYDLK